tara:strand:- start:73 stop:1170 length:1098 start_codon:yes stop_codon:yes gene_type:complete
MNKAQLSLFKLISDLCLIPGLSGHEDEVRDYLKNKLKKQRLSYDSDNLGNLVCTLEGQKNYPSVMLFAHMDQLGFVVKKIENNGLIKVERLGGVPEKVLPSLSVVVKNKKGKYFSGVIANKSHHATLPEEKYNVATFRDLFFDFGFSSKEQVIKNNINIGSPITYKPCIEVIGSNCLAGTSLDDRVGCGIILEVLEKLEKIKNRPTVHVVFSVQEEFNLRGVLPMAQKLNPDIAIQIDIALATDTPEMSGDGDIKLGNGPSMSLYSFHGRGTLNGVIPHPKLVKLFENTASKQNINLQRSATSGILTDASYVQLLGKGIACIDLGFPIRYSHSPNEVCDIRDIFKLKELLFKTIISIDNKINLKR